MLIAGWHPLNSRAGTLSPGAIASAAELSPEEMDSGVTGVLICSATHPDAASIFFFIILDEKNMPSHSSAGIHGPCADIILEIMKYSCSLPALSKFALVHPSWTPLAYICMYRDVHLKSGEDISIFLRCITTPTPSKKHLASFHHRCSLVHTLRITLAEPWEAAREECFHREAFLDLFQILPQLVKLNRVMFEVHVLSKLIEYEWLTRCATILPKSMKVFIVNVRPISAPAVLSYH